MSFEFQDTVTLDGGRVTRDGYLVADARVARTGIQVYLGREVGKPEMRTVRILRPEDEVFSEDAMASFAYRPVTNDHPVNLVSSATWRDVARGQSGSEVTRDGHTLRVPLMISDADAIADVQAGKRELSAGYTCDLDWTAGTTADGDPYDAIQRNIRANHIAIVSRGRAGPECRIGDSYKEQTVNILIDGASFEVADAAAAAITKLQAAMDVAKASVEARDGEIAGLRTSHASEVASLTARIPDAVALDAAIVARTATIDAARKILGGDFDVAGKTDAAIRRAAVEHKLGERAAGKGDVYIDAAFDTLSVSVAADADPVADALRSNAGKPAVVTDAYAEYKRSLESGYMNTSEKDA